jgi:hypothetical protein
MGRGRGVSVRLSRLGQSGSSRFALQSRELERDDDDEFGRGATGAGERASVRAKPEDERLVPKWRGCARRVRSQERRCLEDANKPSGLPVGAQEDGGDEERPDEDYEHVVRLAARGAVRVSFRDGPIRG